MCSICINGKKAEKKLLTTNSQQLVDDVELYHQHVFFKDKQRKFFKKSIENTTNTSYIIILDFKQNFKMGDRPIKTN